MKIGATMQVQQEAINENGDAFMLAPILNIESAEDFLCAVKEHVAKVGLDKNILLDASKVESITTPAIQVIIALSKIAERNGGSITVRSPSEAISKVFQTIGLYSLLEKWSLK
jgi:anti-anti-sigma factor